MNKYEEVPAMISGKDLDYISDMYTWNFNTCKFINNIKDNISDEEINALLNSIYVVHKENINDIIELLK